MAEQLLPSEGPPLRDLDRRLRNLEASRRVVSLHNRILRLRRAANQVVPPSTPDYIAWDTEDEDPEGWIAVTNTVFTVVRDGMYVGVVRYTITAGALSSTFLQVADVTSGTTFNYGAIAGRQNFKGFLSAGQQLRVQLTADVAGVTFTARLDIARVSL